MRTKSASVQFLSILLLGASLCPVWAEESQIDSSQTSARLNSTESDAGNLFYTQLASSARAVFPGSDIKPIRFPEQGNFHWYYQNVNSVHRDRFNSATYDYLSGNVDGRPQPELVDAYKLSPSGTFPIEYASLLDKIAFTLSKADERRLKEAMEKVQTQERQVVESYESSFGEITSDHITAARETIPSIATPLDYVISYVLGTLWSGRTPPLTWVEMQSARSLKDLLPLRPASGTQVLSKVSEYLAALGPVASLEDQQNEGGFKLQQLKRNTRFPTSANGGMFLVEPSGAVKGNESNVKYMVNKSIGELEGDLNNEGRKISLSMETSTYDEEALSVSFSGSAGVRFILGDIISFSGGASTTYNMNRFQGASASSTIELTFPGVTLVPASASPWQEATNLGWYYGKPVQEAWSNWERARRKEPELTGYTFISDPQLGEDGRGLGKITSLLISNYPTIKITFRNADYRRFEESWRTVSRGYVTLFGFIVVGSSSEETYSSRLEQGQSNSTFTLTFEPTPSSAWPVLQRTAYVIGGQVEFPALAP